MKLILTDYVENIYWLNIEKHYVSGQLSLIIKKVILNTLNLNALVYRHNLLVNEATNRGYNFKHLPNSQAIPLFNIVPKSWDDQEHSLSLKECDCVKQEIIAQ